MNSVHLIEESPTEPPKHQFICRDSSLSSGFVSYIKASLVGLELLLLSLSHLSEFVNDPLKGKHLRLFFIIYCRMIKVIYCNRSKLTFLSVSSTDIEVLRTTSVAEKQNQLYDPVSVTPSFDNKIMMMIIYIVQQEQYMSERK